VEIEAMLAGQGKLEAVLVLAVVQIRCVALIVMELILTRLLYTWGRSGHDYKGGTVISVEDSDYGASFKVTLGLHIPGTKPYVVEVPDWKIRRLTGSVDDISDIPEDVPFDLRPHLTGL